MGSTRWVGKRRFSRFTGVRPRVHDRVGSPSAPEEMLARRMHAVQAVVGQKLRFHTAERPVAGVQFLFYFFGLLRWRADIWYSVPCQ